MRRALPQVDVIALPFDPSHYTRTLSQYLMFETASFTVEDFSLDRLREIERSDLDRRWTEYRQMLSF